MKKITSILSVSSLILSIISVILICNIYSNVQQIKENNNIPRKGSITINKVYTQDDILPDAKFEKINY